MTKTQWTILLLAGGLLALYYFSTQSAGMATGDTTSDDGSSSSSGSGWSTVSVQGPTTVVYPDGSTTTLTAGNYD